MKQMKVLGVIAVALTLGLTACGGTKECKTHKWGEWEIVTAETCTTDGLQKRTCTVCKKVEEKKINKGHKWNAWETVTASTCTVAGSQKRTCQRCDAEETQPLDLAPHTYVVDAEGNEVITWTTAPDCTNAGVGGHRTCSVCGTEVAVSSSEAAALGHNFHKDAEGNIEFTWTTAPSCELPGVGTKHCDRCGQDVAATDEERAKLGHDVEAIGGEVAPTDGTAAVRLYHCKRCDQTFMGFLANEVTNDSKAHVAFEPETVTEGQEQGARFLGRPIGNALALDSTGTSVNKSNGECVYCSTETGDFIEYAFNLNATQAATLATCRMYCDAKPADYLNGTDFWAYSGSNDEWTPGFYIDGGDERFEKDAETDEFVMVQDHEKAAFDSQPGAAKTNDAGEPVMVRQGKRIEDYRYVLYVDGNVVDFDPETENPTHGSNTNMQREEFELPYTFHLHEGLNKIKFVMAGGYRSLFYKCIFRPYVAPTQVTVENAELEVREGKTVEIKSSMTGLQYASSNASIATVDDKGVVTGVKAGEATITVSKDGNYKPAKVKVTVLEKEGIVNLDIQSAVINPAEGGIDPYTSGSSGFWYRNPKANTTLTYTFQSELAGRFDLQFGLRGSNIDVAANMSVKVNDKDVAVSGTVNTQYSAVEYVIGQADLNKGENTMVITFLADSSLYIKSLKLVPHVYVAFQTWSCEDCEAARSTAEWESTKEFGGEKAFKFNKAGYVEVSYNSTGAQKVMLQLKIAVKYSNRTSTGFWKQSGAEKTRITINGKAIAAGAEPDFSKVKDSGVNDNGTISVPEWFNIIEIDLQDGANTIKVEFIAGGYSYYLGGIALAK